MYNSLVILFFLLGIVNVLCLVRMRHRKGEIIHRLHKESQQTLILLTELKLIMLCIVMSVLFLVIFFALGLITIMIKHGYLTL